MNAIERAQAKLGLSITGRLLNFDISDDTRERMARFRQELVASKPPANVVMVFNHQAYSDPGAWFHIARTVDPDVTRKAAVLTSQYHTSFLHNPIFASIAWAGGLLTGLTIIPTVQRYQIEDPKYGYTYTDGRKNLEDMLGMIKNIRKPAMILMAPEGTRSKTGAMGKAEEGAVGFGSRLAPVYYAPFAVWLEEPFNREGLNSRLTQKNPPVVHVEMGEVIFQADKHHGPKIKDVMHELALALPSRLRGPW